MADIANNEKLSEKSNEESVDSFGASLRRERELRSVPLEDIALATNIQLSYLEAIENDNYQYLPHPTFVRGFIRSYAVFIGLNHHDVINHYDQFMAASVEGEVDAVPIGSQDNKNAWLLVMVVSVFLVVLAVSGYYLATYIKSLKENPIPAATMQIPPAPFSRIEPRPKMEKKTTGQAEEDTPSATLSQPSTPAAEPQTGPEQQQDVILSEPVSAKPEPSPPAERDSRTGQ